MVMVVAVVVGCRYDGCNFWYGYRYVYVIFGGGDGCGCGCGCGLWLLWATVLW